MRGCWRRCSWRLRGPGVRAAPRREAVLLSLRNSYFTVMLGLIGVFLTIGAVARFSAPWLLGALCVLASPLAVIRSDFAASKHADGTRYTPLRTELGWLLAAALLAVAGVSLFGIFP